MLAAAEVSKGTAPMPRAYASTVSWLTTRSATRSHLLLAIARTASRAHKLVKNNLPEENSLLAYPHCIPRKTLVFVPETREKKTSVETQEKQTAVQKRT